MSPVKQMNEYGSCVNIICVYIRVVNHAHTKTYKYTHTHAHIHTILSLTHRYRKRYR